MENNQHSSGERNTTRDDANSFRNEQPGQQLPSNANKETGNVKTPTQNEQHSESSLPRKENETLGTP